MADLPDSPDVFLSESEVLDLVMRFLVGHGLSREQAAPVASSLAKAQKDGCRSHGLQRLPGVLDTIAHPRFDKRAEPELKDVTDAVAQVDARFGFSLPAVERGLPSLVAKAKALGISMLAINNGFHFTALWPVVEEIAGHGLAALSMNPSHGWVAPFGGGKGILGTNPMAFAWPRKNQLPYVFDFATSAAARADIALYKQQGKPLPEGWGLDADGRPSTDPAAVLAGAMLPFGGHKGSALATMIELMSSAMIGDRSSRQSQAFDAGAKAAPCHGELIVAFNPALLAGGSVTDDSEALLDEIARQGARLPGSRRYRERQASEKQGIRVPGLLYSRILALMPD